MTWNYPPGVTGNEYEIAGPDYERESDIPCSACDSTDTLEQGYRERRWLICKDCDAQDGLPDRWCCDRGPVGHRGRCQEAP